MDAGELFGCGTFLFNGNSSSESDVRSTSTSVVFGVLPSPTAARFEPLLSNGMTSVENNL